MDIEQHEYLEETGDTAGVIVVIRSQNQMPFPEDDGVILSPGHATSIAISQTMVTRLSDPYGDCIHPSDTSNSHNAYAEFFPVVYTAQSCEKTCYQRNVIEQCQCSDAYFPSANASAFNYANVPVCSTNNITQDDCRYEVFMQFTNGQLNCKCPDRCWDVLFRKETSTFSWPSKYARSHVLSLLKNKLGSKFDSGDANLISNNLLRVEIFYKEFNYEEIEETPAYPLLQYISDSGGVLGLWFGFAIMTFIEFFEFFVDFIILTINRIRYNLS